MRRFALLASALVTVGCASPGPTAARPATSAAPALALALAPRAPVAAPTLRPRLSGRVDVVAEDAPLGDVLDRIGRQVGWNLVCEPQASRLPVTIRLFDLPWRDALELLLARERCEAAPAGENTLYVTEPVRITIQF